MSIAGIDLSTHAIDVVVLDEDTDAATWHRYQLVGDNAFDRARAVRAAMPGASFWDDVLAIGIEQPRGHHGTVHIARVQGAILACIPTSKLVHPMNPASWRKTVGLPGNASKDAVAAWVRERRQAAYDHLPVGIIAPPWPQDACDAYCIALATRTLLEHKDAA
jgi:hypothetical protein